VINSAANDYVLTTSDTLEMSVFQEPDLTTRSKIGSDGSVQLPLIGDTKVAGLTVRAARELITKRYDARYLVNPQVYLNVIGYAQKKFTILGQVTKPGTYELPGGGTLSLLEAVGLAGGFTRSADRGKVLIQRNRETLRINAKKLSGEGDASFTVKAGDVITVGESWF
jgi:polysaccharide export outer membrane protein